MVSIIHFLVIRIARFVLRKLIISYILYQFMDKKDINRNLIDVVKNSRNVSSTINSYNVKLLIGNFALNNHECNFGS